MEHLPLGVVASLLVLQLTDDQVLLVCAERLLGSLLVGALSFFDLIPSTEVPSKQERSKCFEQTRGSFGKVVLLTAFTHAWYNSGFLEKQ